jgi:hypothetical protein
MKMAKIIINGVMAIMASIMAKMKAARNGNINNGENNQ